MPKQVWQADDGEIFDSEEACIQYEKADKLLRPLFKADGSKKSFDYEEMEYKLDYVVDDLDLDHPREVVGLLLLLHKVPEVYCLDALLDKAGGMQELGAYLKSYKS